MNSNTILSSEEYLLSLEKTRDVELPQQLSKIDEEIEKLKKQRMDVLNKIENVTLEITNFKAAPRLKSLVDIPSTAWQIIQQCAISGQNCAILNVCLSSPKLDLLIRQDKVAKTLRITGEKVFRVLLNELYLDRNDVVNCLNSNSNDLERFAGSNWPYGNKNVLPGIMTLEKVFQCPASIAQFVQTANQQKGKYQFFAFKDLTFDTSLCKSNASREEFWNSVLSLLETFGNFILHIKFNDKSGGKGMPGISKGLLQGLLRIESFDVVIYNSTLDCYNYFSMTSDKDGNHSLSFNFTTSTTLKYLEEVGPKCQTWWLRDENLNIISEKRLSPYISRNLKVLKLNLPHTSGELQKWLNADVTDFASTDSLVLEGYSGGICALTLLEKFPRVKTITIVGASQHKPQYNDDLFQCVRSPTVTRLILSGHYTFSPMPLDRIPELLPSLVQLTIKCTAYNKTNFILKSLQPAFRKRHFQRQNKVIDVYHVYCEGRSLLESNIWDHMKNLLRINVETMAAYGKRRVGGTTETFVRQS